jgi:hypothetical protein
MLGIFGTTEVVLCYKAGARCAIVEVVPCYKARLGASLSAGFYAGAAG